MEYKAIALDNDDTISEWQREINREWKLGWEVVCPLQLAGYGPDTRMHSVILLRKVRSSKITAAGEVSP